MLNIVSHHVHKAPWFQNFVDLCKHFIIVVVFYFRFAVKHHGIRILCFYFRPVREVGIGRILFFSIDVVTPCVIIYLLPLMPEQKVLGISCHNSAFSRLSCFFKCVNKTDCIFFSTICFLLVFLP